MHSIMMEKLAQAGEGGGCTPLPFYSGTITHKIAVSAPGRGQKLTLFHLYPYVLCDLVIDKKQSTTEYTGVEMK